MLGERRGQRRGTCVAAGVRFEADGVKAAQRQAQAEFSESEPQLEKPHPAIEVLLTVQSDRHVGIEEKLTLSQPGSVVVSSRAQVFWTFFDPFTQLRQAELVQVSPERRNRINELAEALFQSIRMQLNSKLHAGEYGRGTSQDTIDRPLNDRFWLKGEFAKVRLQEKEDERLKSLNTLVNRTDAGPGSFYDDLGDPNRQPHLVPNVVPFAENPDFRKSVFTSFDYRADRPREWWTNVLCLYDGALKMHYEGLDPTARYRLKFVYSSEPLRKVKVKLEAEGQTLQDWTVKPDEMTPVEIDVPPAATADGLLDIQWTRELGLGGNGRGCQVAEVWLLRQP